MVPSYTKEGFLIHYALRREDALFGLPDTSVGLPLARSTIAYPNLNGTEFWTPPQ